MRTKLILLSIAVSCVLAGCNSQPNATGHEMPSVPVIAATPVIKDITVYLESVGTLHPSVYMEIRPQVSGTIDKVFVKEGQTIQKGTPLFKIDAALYEMKVSEATAQLAMDRAGFEAARKKMNRYRGLAEKDFISETEWDELQAQVDRAKAAIELDEARLSASQIDLEHCTLRSPIDGRVGKLDANPGQLVSSAQATPLATISKMDPLVIEFTVTEKEYSKIDSWDLPIEMQPLCASGLCKGGTITFLDNHFDTKTGLLLIRGNVSNADGSLRPGQSVRARVPISVVLNAKLIPQKAIRYNQQGPYVYVVQPDSTVVLRQLILGDEQGVDQIVQEGVDPEELIIVDGHLRLSPGVKVEVKS